MHTRTLMAQDGYTSLRDELERFPRPSFLDEEFARTREHQRAEQKVGWYPSAGDKRSAARRRQDSPHRDRNQPDSNDLSDHREHEENRFDAIPRSCSIKSVYFEKRRAGSNGFGVIAPSLLRNEATESSHRCFCVAKGPTRPESQYGRDDENHECPQNEWSRLRCQDEGISCDCSKTEQQAPGRRGLSDPAVERGSRLAYGTLRTA